jgi:hypothetical protein
VALYAPMERKQSNKVRAREVRCRIEMRVREVEHYIALLLNNYCVLGKH